MLSCRTLGALEVLRDGKRPPRELKRQKLMAFLLYLAHSPRGSRAKQHLISLLWPDIKKPNQSVSQTQSLLRKQGVDVTETSAGQIHLDLGNIDLDTDRFEELTAAGRWADAAALVDGPFLDGFRLPRAAEFDDWITTQREHWGEKCVDALVRHAEDLMAAGATEQSVPVVERSVELAPHSDRVERARLTALWLLRRRDEALESHRRFAKRLKADLGNMPEAETLALVKRIQEGSSPTPGRGRLEPPRRAPLVGRERELKAIVDCWTRCRQHKVATLALVLGDPGSGKTRFVDEVVGRAHLAEASTIVIRAVPSDLAEAESGLVALSEGGLLEAPGVPSAPAQALAALASRSSAWADRFPPRGSTEPCALARAFSEIVRAATRERPVLLAVDDAHWMDAESFKALNALLRDLPHRPVMVLLAATPDPVRPELEAFRSRLGRDQKGAAVTLDLFGEDELAALVRWALPRYSDEQTERLVRRVLADTGGLPLLAFEMISAVASGLDVGPAGIVSWPSHKRTLYDTFPGDLPDAVVGAVRVSYSRLSAHAQLALVAAAVIGERASRKLIKRATALPEGRLGRALNELEWQRWLVAEPRGYVFLARIIRDLVLPMKTNGERARMRERAGLPPVGGL